MPIVFNFPQACVKFRSKMDPAFARIKAKAPSLPTMSKIKSKAKSLAPAYFEKRAAGQHCRRA